MCCTDEEKYRVWKLIIYVISVFVYQLIFLLMWVIFLAPLGNGRYYPLLPQYMLYFPLRGNIGTAEIYLDCMGWLIYIFFLYQQQQQ